jgi:hypothetical protein
VPGFLHGEAAQPYGVLPDAERITAFADELHHDLVGGRVDLVSGTCAGKIIEVLVAIGGVGAGELCGEGVSI